MVGALTFICALSSATVRRSSWRSSTPREEKRHGAAEDMFLRIDSMRLSP